MATITAPVEGFSGNVVGVDFKDGTGETDNTAQIQYFTRHGYAVEAPKPKRTPAPKPAAEKE